VRVADLEVLGVRVSPLPDVRVEGGWAVNESLWQTWVAALPARVTAYQAARPLEAGMPAAALVHDVGIADLALLPPLLLGTGLTHAEGRVRSPGRSSLGPAEAGVAEVERRLSAAPFAAPDQEALAALGLDPRALAAAERAGRLLRLGPGLVLLPDAPARAVEVLAALPQPFTLSAARLALGTTRRVAVPLLEHLDRHGATRRVDGDHRVVRG
jgi:selenocysteine-specific elongation factor